METDTAPRKAAISNGALARYTGMNHSMISRMRAGLRRPSIVTMAMIERSTKWKIESQARSLANGTYAADLEAALIRTYGAEGDGE